MAVVKFFEFSDLTHPDKDKITTIDSIPITKEAMPAILGKVRLSPVILKGNPLLVIMRIFVMAKIDTKKEAVAVVAALNRYVIRVDVVSPNEKIRDNENPANKELITIN